MFLYKLTFESGKSYVGQTVRTLETRLSQHKQAANAGSLLAVHCAWRAHGEPSVEVLGRYADAEDLHRAEIEAIVAHGTMSPAGYNIGFGGETAPSKNPEVAAKISAKARGRRHTDKSRAALAKSSANLWGNEAYRQKVADGIAAAWTPEQRAAAGERARKRWEDRRASGWQMSPEARAKISARELSEETRAKMSASAKARVREAFSPEACARISARTKEAWADPEITAKRLEAIKAARATPEVTAKQTAAAVASWQDPEVRARRIAAIRAAKARKKQAAESQS